MERWEFVDTVLILLAGLLICIGIFSCKGAEKVEASLFSYKPSKKFIADVSAKQKIELTENVDQIVGGSVKEVKSEIRNTVNDLWATIGIVLAAQAGFVTVAIVWANKRQLKAMNGR